MIIAPGHGFVLLSLPKAASTSLDDALGCYHSPPPGRAPDKHQNLAMFHRHTAPRIAAAGWPRERYDVVCLFRDPVDWLESWWRYRRRPHTREHRADRFTGDVSFEEFVRLFLTDKPATGIKGRPARFLAGDAGRGVRIDRVFAVDRPEVWTEWFEGQVGAPVEVARRNRAGADRPPPLPADLRDGLTSYFAPEYHVVEHLAVEGQWQPPPGYRPPGLGA